jgi:hypothetical protein
MVTTKYYPCLYLLDRFSDLHRLRKIKQIFSDTVDRGSNGYTYTNNHNTDTVALTFSTRPYIFTKVTTYLSVVIHLQCGGQQGQGIKTKKLIGTIPSIINKIKIWQLTRRVELDGNTSTNIK